ncbi:hypothetical protein M569_00267 [Genlisea aurea]|uniref:TLDc domain-containing protein n=1 Tax=Genlisea aurea TaxID=192259 RepID=S8EES7_9LAMI|nr:hypothetical protein M569_00267 [Genlisea aurea]
MKAAFNLMRKGLKLPTRKGPKIMLAQVVDAIFSQELRPLKVALARDDLQKNNAIRLMAAVQYPWRRSSAVVSLFSRDSKKGKERPPESTYHDDVRLPFPASLVAKTFLRDRELKCCYDAAVDGFSAANFHHKCDFKGPCVVIGYTDTSLKFGAFSPEGYRSTDDYYDTFDAFLFYWENEAHDQEPIVLPKVGGSGAALFDYARGGPQFGADGLLIGPPLAPVMGGFAGPDTNSGVGDLRRAKSRLGLSYAKRPDGKESLFGDESKASLVQVLVFCSPYIASLY